MAAPSINRHIDWQQVLDVLHCPVTGGALPLSTACPRCGTNQLHVFHDSIYGGGWQYCFNCRTGGDMAELLARVWGCSVADALWRFRQTSPASSGVLTDSDAVERYMQQHIARRAAYQQFWQESSDRVVRQPELAAEVVHGGNWPELQPLREKAAQLFGCCPVTQLRELFSGRIRGLPRASRRARFALVLPLIDLPGRIIGFSAVWRANTGGWEQQDILLAPAKRLYNRWHQETGFSQLHTLFRRNPVGFQDLALILHDHWLAVRYHLHYLRDSQCFLPLLGASCRMSQRGARRIGCFPCSPWRHCGTRRTVLHVDAPRAALFNAAAAGDSSVFRREQMQRGGTPVHVIMKRWLRASRPWERVLSEMLDNQDETGSINTVLDLQLDPTMQRRLHQAASAPVRRLLDTHLRQQPAEATVRIGNDEISETRAGWVCRKSGEIISPVILCITEIVRRGDDVQYCGTVRFAGRSAKFLCPASRIERQTAAWLREFCLRKNLGIPVFGGRRKWRAALLDIALAFRKPQILTNPHGVGWEQQSGLFLFPEFRIATTGVRTEPGGFEPGAPMAGVSPEIDVANADISPVITPTEDNALLWAALLAFSTAIVSPVFRQEIPNIVLAGSAAEVTGRRLAELLGCPVVGGGDPQFLRREWHNWPVLLRTTLNTQHPAHRTLLQRLLSSNTGRAVLSTTHTAADRMLLGPPAVVFRTTENHPAPSLLSVFGNGLFFSWLEDFAAAGFVLPQADTLLLRVTESWRRWLLIRGHYRKVLDRALPLLELSSQAKAAASAFGRLLYAALQRGDIRVQHAEFSDPDIRADRSLFEMDTPAGIFIGYPILGRICNRLRLPLFDRWRLLEALSDADILVQEHELGGIYGVIIRRDWWVSQMRQRHSTPAESAHAS